MGLKIEFHILQSELVTSLQNEIMKVDLISFTLVLSPTVVDLGLPIEECHYYPIDYLILVLISDFKLP